MRCSGDGDGLTLGTSTSVITCCSSFSPRKLATIPATRCARLICSTVEYLTQPHSATHVTNSSKLIVSAPSPPGCCRCLPPCATTKAYCTSIAESDTWKSTDNEPTTPATAETAASITSLFSAASAAHLSWWWWGG